jgi:hypothetical protein
MGVRWEPVRMPDEYDPDVLIEIFNNHAAALVQLNDSLENLYRKVRGMASVVWSLSEAVFPETVSRVKERLEEERPMREAIDEIFEGMEDSE